MDSERSTIFLVDDALTNLTIGQCTLEEDYNVVTIDSGGRLLKILERMIPDLILLDIDMPEMNGYQVIERIKCDHRFENIPVIFLTSSNDSESELRGLSLGAVDYIAKPFSPPLLLKRIELHLLVQNQQQELIRFNENLVGMVDEKTATVMQLQNAVLKIMGELVEFRDDNTGGHIERTQSYLRILVAAFKKSPAHAEQAKLIDAELVVLSAQLHDVGKIAIDDSILRKPGRLTDEEFEKVKEHTVVGEEIIARAMQIAPQQNFLEQAAILAATHHERWDGRGYPRGLAGEDIPIQGRMMAIADVYDALVSERPYKKAFSHAQAVDIIKSERGTQFDPSLVDLFLEVNDEFERVYGHTEAKEVELAEC